MLNFRTVGPDGVPPPPPHLPTPPPAEGCWDPRGVACQRLTALFLWTGVQKQLCLGCTCCSCQVVIFEKLLVVQDTQTHTHIHTLSLSLSLPSVYTVRHRRQERMRGLCCWFITLLTVRRVWETLLPCSDEDEDSVTPSTVQYFNHTGNLRSAVIYLTCLVLVDGTRWCLRVHCLFPALSQQPLAERQEHHRDGSPVYHHPTPVWSCAGIQSDEI